MTKFVLPLLLGLVGCSLQKLAIRSSTPVFEKSSQGLMRENNWDFFKTSTPANLKMMELLWHQDKENLKLLSLLIQGFSGYAFAVPETLYFGDELKGVDESPWKEEALSFYTRALDYGLIYLDHKKINRDLLLSNNETELKERLKDIEEEDLRAFLYTAQAWGSLINLQKDNVALVSHIPKVKLIFDRVCELKPDIDHNVCDIFFAQYESTRPKMLGGNPQKGAELYLKAIEKHPKNLLIRMSYIVHVLLPGYEEKKYAEHADILKEEFSKWSDLNRDSLRNNSSYEDHSELNLYNGIAKKRFEFIEKYKNEIF